jgi:hypothetical protein
VKLSVAGELLVFAVILDSVDFTGVVGHFWIGLPDLGAVFPGSFSESKLISDI